ncbi:50S ribosomal protein L31 [Candidatus Saccharibacteria bacterium]|nr:50S ribosomal protein L31 [Candidatus Saccharibacteria bacterium]
MKAAIHPEYMKTKVTCLGCNTTFESMSTVPEMSVDVCSMCHPFYTGKQKLVDTAGRVDRFKARQLAADAKKDALVKKGQKALTKAETAAMLQADSEVTEENTTKVTKDTQKAKAKPEVKTEIKTETKTEVTPDNK